MKIWLHYQDWMVIGFYVLLMLFIGVFFARRAMKSTDEYFMAHRSLRWYMIALDSTVSVMGGLPILLSVYYTMGISMQWIGNVQFVTFLPFVSIFLAPMWRRLRLHSTPEFLHKRYGGHSGEQNKRVNFFRSMYGLFMTFGWGALLVGYILGYTSQAMAGPIFHTEPWKFTLIICAFILVYSSLSGLYGVVSAAFAQFFFYALGFALAIPFALKHVGGFHQMYATLQLTNPDFLYPFPGKSVAWSMLAVLFIQAFFLGVHPNFGEGFIAQKFIAAKNEAHAKVGLICSSLLSAVIIGLPTAILATVVAAKFPGLSETECKSNFARMLTLLPPGVLGVLLIGEIAAITGTIDNVTNWGGCVLDNDVYRLQIVKNASAKHYARMGVVFTILMLVIGSVIGALAVDRFFSWFLFITSAAMTFLLPIGFFRYFWWRFNLSGEIVGILIGLPASIFVWFVLGGSAWPFYKVFITLFGSGFIIILVTTLLTKPTDMRVLQEFYTQGLPPGFWGPVKRSLGLTRAPQAPGEKSWAGKIKEYFLVFATMGSMAFSITSFLSHRKPLFLGAFTCFIVLAVNVYFVFRKSLKERDDAVPAIPEKS